LKKEKHSSGPFPMPGVMDAERSGAVREREGLDRVPFDANAEEGKRKKGPQQITEGREGCSPFGGGEKKGWLRRSAVIMWSSEGREKKGVEKVQEYPL